MRAKRKIAGTELGIRRLDDHRPHPDDLRSAAAAAR